MEPARRSRYQRRDAAEMQPGGAGRAGLGQRGRVSAQALGDAPAGMRLCPHKCRHPGCLWALLGLFSLLLRMPSPRGAACPSSHHPAHR